RARSCWPPACRWARSGSTWAATRSLTSSSTAWWRPRARPAPASARRASRASTRSTCPSPDGPRACREIRPRSTTPPSVGETYEAAGVSIAAGEEAVARIKERVRSTFRPEVVGDIGGFGGLFAFDPSRYRDPVLVSSTDGVGTKALVAQATGRFTTIGIDLIAMCVDDIAAQGAEPLFFLDYIAVGKLEPDQVEDLVAGMVDGCRRAGCALIGGEMAEHPGALEPGEFDLVGFTVGVAERDRLITGGRIQPGDRLVGLRSGGLRSNGYSLARRVLLDVAGLDLDSPAWPGAHHSLADQPPLPSDIYAPALVALTAGIDVGGLAHVTGGGIPGNL